MNEEEAIRLMKSLLERMSAQWSEEGGFLRFRARHGGMLWEAACRPCKGALLLYSRFPFQCREPDRARQRCEEINRRLVRGAMFLAEDGNPVYRCRAELDDAFGAEDRIAEALKYSAQVMARYWGPLSGI